MSRRHPEDTTAAAKAARRAAATVLVRLDETLPEVRARIEAAWDRREAKARSLRAIKDSTGPRHDSAAVMSEGQAMSGGMSRGKDSVASDVTPGKGSRRDLGGEIVRPDEDNLAVSDGVSDDRSEVGEFIRKPQPRPVTY
jgi:hypothetical protein